MDSAIGTFAESDLSWTSVHVPPSLKRGSRLNRSIHSEEGDRVQHIIDNYPFYKSRVEISISELLVFFKQ